MQRIPISKYARMHKKSIFEVVKEIQSGKLQSEEVKENGVIKRYIILSDNSIETTNKEEKIDNIDENIDLSIIYRELKRLSIEVAMLREELKSYLN